MGKIESNGADKPFSIKQKYDKNNSGQIDSYKEWNLFKNDLKTEYGKIYGEKSEKYKLLNKRLDHTFFDQGELGEDQEAGHLYQPTGINFTHQIRFPLDTFDKKFETKNELKAEFLKIASIVVHEEEHAQQAEYLHKDLSQKGKKLFKENFDQYDFDKFYENMYNLPLNTKAKHLKEALEYYNVPEAQKDFYLSAVKKTSQMDLAEETGAFTEETLFLQAVKKTYPKIADLIEFDQLTENISKYYTDLGINLESSKRINSTDDEVKIAKQKITAAISYLYNLKTKKHPEYLDPNNLNFYNNLIEDID